MFNRRSKKKRTPSQRKNRRARTRASQVEMLEKRELLNVDYGDAPDPSYPTLLASSGASHTIVPGFQLGSAIDGETDGRPSVLANGDGFDDDGVTFTSTLISNQQASVVVNASQAGFLDAWIDFSANGNWSDSGDQIFVRQALVAGTKSLTFPVPETAVSGITYARFRFSSEGGLSETGPAIDGEVEDYRVVINPTGSSSPNFKFTIQALENENQAGDILDEIPESKDFVHEWETFALQLWAQMPVITSGSIDAINISLDFDSLYFGDPVMNDTLGSSSISILDSTGDSREVQISLSNLNTANILPGDKFLVSELTFPPSPEVGRGLLANTVINYATPTRANPFIINSASFDLSSASNLAGALLQQELTEIVPVIYDIDDDDRVGLTDLSKLVNIFGKDVHPNLVNSYAADFDRSGTIGLTDLSRLVNHFGSNQSNNQEIIFPNQFFTFNETDDSLKLIENNQFAVEEKVPVTLGQSSGTRKLSFDIEAYFGETNPSSLIEDAFLIYLVDSNNHSQTLLDNGKPGTAVFSLSGDRVEYLSGLVKYDGSTVEIDVSTLDSYDEGTLVFQLINADSDRDSYVSIGPITNQVDLLGTKSLYYQPQTVLASVDGELDVQQLSPLSNIALTVENIRYDSATGLYQAELRLQNNSGVHIGRKTAVVLENLPSGVQLLDASGVDSSGNPYLNLTKALPAGGLPHGQTSEAVSFVISNPEMLRFPLNLKVLSGGPNQSPVLDFVNPITVSPGGYVEINLAASDPDGDTLVYSIQSDVVLPSATLTQTGKLTFSPLPGQEGSYEFTISVSDGALQASHLVTLNVEADLVTTTRISGRVLELDGTPLVGVPVSLSRLSVLTDAEGRFTIELPSHLIPTEEFDISVPTGDIYFDPFSTGEKTIDFRRARYDTSTGTSVSDPRRHPNLVTGFLDGSVIYGSDDERAMALRTLDGTGKLKTSTGDLLPLNNPTFFPDGALENDSAGLASPADMFVAGDVRSSENPALSSLHTVLLREHNRIAEALLANTPSLTDEQVYQQARRLVIAKLQHITYNEYLPMLLGANSLATYSGYDTMLEPGIGAFFTTVAFRFGHSTAQEEMSRLDSSGTPLAAIGTQEGFFNTSFITTDGVDDILRGIASQVSEEIDTQVISALRNTLFGPPGSGGLDLPAMSIQRGRDLGLPGYNQARVDLGLAAVTSFAEITSNVQVQNALEATYGSVDEIDAFVGGLAEDHVSEAILGELFHTAIKKQFENLRDADRFWYENGMFTADELVEIRGTTLSNLIEGNTSITTLPASVFSTISTPAGPAAAGTAAATPFGEFRTLDGSGNNITNTTWGEAGSHLLIDTSLNYADGISEPNGANRPSAREVSNGTLVQTGVSLSAAGATDMFVFWGQLLAHDLSQTPTGTSNTLKIHADDLEMGDIHFPLVAEKIELLLENPLFEDQNNVISRPIYLPRLDMANSVMINPGVTTTATVQLRPSALGVTEAPATLVVSAGVLIDRAGMPFTGALSITEVPADLTPASLPANLSPDTVVTIQPSEMQFAIPAALTLPNRAGYLPGTTLDLWSINPETGEFEIVGLGQVSPDGSVIETIEGGVRSSSWHLFAPPQPLPPPTFANPKLSTYNLANGACAICGNKVLFNSVVETHSGAVIETHNLVSYQSLGVARGLSLVYDSLRADPRPIVNFGFGDNSGGNVISDQLFAKLSIDLDGTTYQLPGYSPDSSEFDGQLNAVPADGGEHFFSPIPGGGLAALQMDLSFQKSGRYEYDLTTGVHRRWFQQVGVDPVFDNGELLGYRKIISVERFATTSQDSKADIIHINTIDSPLGSGWGFAGLQELVENSDGSVLLLDGDGSEMIFEAPLSEESSVYQSPVHGYSVFEKLPDGTFRRTMTDQTEYRFDANNRLQFVEDRNGNTMEYVYDLNGHLEKIIDPVGLETLISFMGERISTITDPAGKVTMLEYDAAGNLIKITDPDTSSRQFEYDSKHHITAETDQLGNREESFYNFAGRAVKAVLKDGTVREISPVQTQNLRQPDATTDPSSPSELFPISSAESSYVDSNGNVSNSTVNKDGQLVQTSDSSGLGQFKVYNDGNLVATKNADGSTVNYEYDELGNLISIQDDIDRGLLPISGSIDTPGAETSYLFTLTESTQLYFDMVTSDFSLMLKNSTGDILEYSDYMGDIIQPGRILTPGTYTLQVGAPDYDPGFTGPFQFFIKNLDSAFPVELGTGIRAQLRSDEVDIYKFEAEAGGVFNFLSGGDDSSYIEWSLIDTNGGVLFQNSFQTINNLTLITEGTYYVVIQGDSELYDIEIQQVGESTFPPVTVTPLQVGDIVTGDFLLANQRDRYTFTLNEDSQLYFDSLTNNSSVKWTLTGPTGTAVNRSWFNSNSSQTLRDMRLIAGDYELTIDSIGSASGEYSFRLLDFANATPIAIDSIVDNGLASPGETDIYQFTLSSEEQLFFSQISQGSGLNRTSWRVVSADGDELFSSNRNSYEPPPTLSAGSYYFLIEGSVLDSGSSSNSGPMINGGFGAKSGTVTDSQSSTLEVTLDVTEGNVEFDRYVSSEGSYDYLRFYIDGNLQDSWSGTVPTSRVSFAVSAGEHTFRWVYSKDSSDSDGDDTAWIDDINFPGIAPEGFETGDFSALPWTVSGNADWSVTASGEAFVNPYSFIVINPVDPAPVAMDLDTVVSGEVGFYEQNTHTFTLAEDTLLYLDSFTNDSYLGWTLTGPSGIIVDRRPFAYSDSGSVGSPVINAMAGNYTLTVEGDSDDTGPYDFRLSTLTSGTVITPGTPFSGDLTPSNETDIYRFDANVGDQFYFDIQANNNISNGNWRLIDPAGDEAFIKTFNDVDTQTVLSTGTYTLLVEGRVNQTGAPDTYTINVQPVSSNAPIPLTLGATTSGSLNVTGEQQQYTFNLASDSRLYFDSLTSNFRFYWMLTGPSGSVVDLRSFNQSDSSSIYNNQIIDAIAGNYTLTIDPTRDYIGAYDFRLSTLASATPITPGTPLSSDLTPSNETDLYRFNANAGDQLYFDVQEHNYLSSGYWRLIDPSGNEVFESNFDDIDTQTVPVTGTYTLLVEGYINEHVTPDTYTINVQPVPNNAPMPLTLGATTSGSLNVAGEQNQYTFNLASDSRLYFDSLTSNFDLNWTLTGLAGTIVDSRSFAFSDADSFSEPVIDAIAGNYTLTVDGDYDATGAYDFRLSTLASATEITPGTPFSGDLTPSNETDLYRFNANAGDQFYFDVQANDSINNGLWRLISPFGKEIFTSYFEIEDPQTVPATGTYTLLVEGDVNEGGDPDSYTINVQPITINAPVPLTLGTTVSDSLDVTGEQNQHTFTLASNSLLYFDSLTSNDDLNWSLTGPTGEIVDRRSFMYSDAGNIADPVIRAFAGDYTLTIAGVGSSTGAYDFRLSTLASATEITPGMPFSGDLTPSNETDLYRFDAIAGDQFLFDVQANDSISDGNWRLIDPYGTETFYSIFDDAGPQTVPATGTYTLLVEGDVSEGGDPDTYTIDVQFMGNTPPPTISGTPLTLGTPISSEIAIADELDHYEFTLGSQTSLYFDSFTPNFDLNWTLTGPSGTVVSNRTFLYSDAGSMSDPAIYAVAGNYVLTVAGSGSTTGAYSFRLSTLASATVITPGTPVSGNLTPSNETDLYRFEANAGDQFYFDIQNNNYISDGYWRLIDPFGMDVFKSYIDDLDTLAVSATGTYTLLVEGDVNGGGGPDTYTFNVQPVTNNAPMPLTLGAATSGNLNITGEQKQYAFTLASDSRLYFDSLTTNDDLYWSLTGPAGVAVDYQYFTDSTPVLNLLTGNYTLTVDGDYDDTGTYGFRLSTLASATEITPGTPFSGDLTPSNETDLYRFNANAGDQFYFDIEAHDYISNGDWRLIDPFGTEVFDSYFNDMGTQTVSATGTYTLLVEGYAYEGGSPDSYTINVQPVIDTAPLASTLGTTIDGVVSIVGEVDVYAFTLENETWLYIDTLIGEYNLTLSLVDSSGEIIVEQDFYEDDEYQNLSMRSVPAGDYEVKVYSDGDTTGNYSFRLLDLATATPINLNTVIDGTLAPAEESDAYQFTLAEEKTLYFDQINYDGYYYLTSWRLIDDSGSEFFDGYAYDQENLTLAAGTYTLLIEGSREGIGNIDPVIGGTFAAHAGSISDQQESGLEVTLDVAAGNIEFDRYISSEGGNDFLTFYIDNVEQDAWSGYIPTSRVAFPVTAGVHTFRWNYTKDEAYDNGYDTAGIDDIAFPGIAPEGFETDDFSSLPWVFTGDADWRTTEFFAPSDTNYSFAVYNPINQPSTAVELDQLVNDSIDMPGQQDEFTFSLASETVLYLEILAGEFDWMLSGPITTTYGSSYDSEYFEDIKIKQYPIGDYVLTIDSYGEAIDYALRILDVSNATPITLDTLVNGDFTPTSVADRYQFTLNSEERIFFDQVSTTTGAYNSSWRVLDVSGNEVFSSFFEDVNTITFAAGTYYLLVEESTYGANTIPILGGDFAAQSGDVDDDQSSVLEVTLDVTDGDVQFDRFVASEEEYDFLRFFIDNVEQEDWSGELQTERVSFAVAAGIHTFKWEYSKDESVSHAGDTAWIDDIVFPGLAAEDFESGNLNSLPWVTSGDANWSVNPLPEETENSYSFAIYRVEEKTPIPLTLLSPNSGQQFAFDATYNRLVSSTDQFGRQTLFDIDPATGNYLSITRVVGQLDSIPNGETDDLVTTFTYTSQGLVDLTTDPMGRVTDYDYDSFGNLQRATFAVGTADEAFQLFEYDTAGNQTAVIDENGSRTEFEYDLQNRLSSIIEADPDGAGPLTSPTSSFEYDARGHSVQAIDASGSTVVSEYDSLDRMTLTRDDLGNETTYNYDGNGNIISTTDPNDNQSTFTYDARNRTTSSTDPDGGVTLYEYDQDDNLISLTDPDDNTTQYIYDARNRLVTEIDPLGAESHYAYDAVGNLVRTIDRNGRFTEIIFDDLDRPIQEAWFNADASLANTINYTYDKVSNLLSVVDESSNLAFTYDNRDRLISSDTTGTLASTGLPAVQLGYTYDGVGNILSVSETIASVAGATTAYQYDALNRMTNIQQSGSGVSEKLVDLVYNELGQFDEIARYSDLARTNLVALSDYEYDELNRLTDLDHKNAIDDLLAFYDFDYDAASRISAITDIDGQTDYAYDDRDQLTVADRGIADTRGDEGYTYDANGNRVDSHLHGTGYVTGENNRLLSDGTYNYDYDNEGNMVRRTEIATDAYREFEFDHRNRMTRVTDFSAGGIITQEVEYTYDALDRRIARTEDADGAGPGGQVTEHFVYDGEHVILDFVDADGSLAAEQPELTTRNLFGPNIDQLLAKENVLTAQTLWMLTDHLGTVRDIIDNTGSVQNHILYDSFGNLLSQTNALISTRYLFTGRELDSATGLYYYRARFYDAATGIFISEDPIGFESGDNNLYRYVLNAPILSVDPSGLYNLGLFNGVGTSAGTQSYGTQNPGNSFGAAAVNQLGQNYVGSGILSQAGMSAFTNAGIAASQGGSAKQCGLAGIQGALQTAVITPLFGKAVTATQNYLGLNNMGSSGMNTQFGATWQNSSSASNGLPNLNSGTYILQVSASW